MSIELKRMTPSRAAYFMERFKREEKLLGPIEDAALTYVIDMLEKATAIQQAEAQQPAPHVNEKHFSDFELLVVTTAYEQGFGHAFRDDLSNPYASGTDAYKAWDMGRSAGKRNGQPQQPATGEPVKGLLRDMQAIADGAIKIPAREFAMHALAEFGAHPAPSVPDDVVRDAERYRWLRAHGRYNDFRVEQETTGWITTHSASSLDAAIDAAMLAAQDSA